MAAEVPVFLSVSAHVPVTLSLLTASHLVCYIFTHGKEIYKPILYPLKSNRILCELGRQFKSLVNEMVDMIQIGQLSPQPPSFLSPSLQWMRGLFLIFKEIKHLGRRSIYPPGSEEAAVSAHSLTTDSAASYSALFFSLT